MAIDTHYKELDERVDGLDRRLTIVETSVKGMREECKAGFTDVKNQLSAIYDERSKWGQWARDNIGRALKWLGAIVLTACGITQTSTIIKLFTNN